MKKISYKTVVFAGAMVLFFVSAMAQPVSQGKRIGIIGLDTSHSTDFTRILNDPSAGDHFGGYKVVAAYPKGSLDIPSSVERIEGYTREVQEQGVEIVGSVEELLPKVDVVLLETNDGRRHLEQALPVLKARKPLFIDKPMAASLADAMAIFEAAAHYQTPVFSTSSLRYMKKMDEVKNGFAGRVLGADIFSPCKFEKTHSDLFWYGIHGVEALFTAMGTGCESVVRVNTDGTDVVTGTWKDGRIGVYRGLRDGKNGYGGTVFGENDIIVLGSYAGYEPLLNEIIQFFKTGIVPVQKAETLEILAFMEAADLSKKKGGAPVLMKEVMKKAAKESKRALKF